jgi:hypothetical protein
MPEKTRETRLNLFVLTTLRDKFFVINGPEKMIELYLAQNKALKPKNPVGGRGAPPARRWYRLGAYLTF